MDEEVSASSVPTLYIQKYVSLKKNLSYCPINKHLQECLPPEKRNFKNTCCFSSSSCLILKCTNRAHKSKIENLKPKDPHKYIYIYISHKLLTCIVSLQKVPVNISTVAEKALQWFNELHILQIFPVPTRKLPPLIPFAATKRKFSCLGKGPKTTSKHQGEQHLQEMKHDEKWSPSMVSSVASRNNAPISQKNKSVKRGINPQLFQYP